MKIDDLIKKYDLIADAVIGTYHFNTYGAAPSKGQTMSIIDNRVYLAGSVISDPNEGILYLNWNYTPDYECELERLYNEFKDALSNYKKLKINQKLLELQDDFS